MAAISCQPMHVQSFVSTQSIALPPPFSVGDAGVPITNGQQQQEMIMAEAVPKHNSSVCGHPAASPAASFCNPQKMVDRTSTHRSYTAAMPCFLRSGEAAAGTPLENVTDPSDPAGWLCLGQDDPVQHLSPLSGAEAQERACPPLGEDPPSCSAPLVSMIHQQTDLTSAPFSKCKSGVMYILHSPGCS